MLACHGFVVTLLFRFSRASRRLVAMGLLSEGSPLTWEETKKWTDHVRKHGIIQFINQYRRLKDRSRDCLMWGDEVSFISFQAQNCQ